MGQCHSRRKESPHFDINCAVHLHSFTNIKVIIVFHSHVHDKSQSSIGGFDINYLNMILYIRLVREILSMYTTYYE